MQGAKFIVQSYDCNVRMHGKHVVHCNCIHIQVSRAGHSDFGALGKLICMGLQLHRGYRDDHAHTMCVY